MGVPPPPCPSSNVQLAKAQNCDMYPTFKLKEPKIASWPISSIDYFLEFVGAFEFTSCVRSTRASQLGHFSPILASQLGGCMF